MKTRAFFASTVWSFVRSTTCVVVDRCSARHMFTRSRSEVENTGVAGAGTTESISPSWMTPFSAAL